MRWLCCLLIALACAEPAPPARPRPAPAKATPKPAPRTLVAPIPTFEPSEKGSGSLAAVRNAWRDLLGAGCDLERVHIWTVVEARVLKATPLAIGGKRFDDPALTAIFQSDGGWYSPLKEEVKLRADEEACIARLAAREEALRAASTLPPAAEDRLVADVGAFAAFWMWGSVSDRDPFDGVASQRNEEGGWTWWAASPGCDAKRCRQYLIRCPASGPCAWGASTDRL